MINLIDLIDKLLFLSDKIIRLLIILFEYKDEFQEVNLSVLR